MAEERLVIYYMLHGLAESRGQQSTSVDNKQGPRQVDHPPSRFHGCHWDYEYDYTYKQYMALALFSTSTYRFTVDNTFTNLIGAVC